MSCRNAPLAAPRTTLAIGCIKHVCRISMEHVHYALVVWRGQGKMDRVLHDVPSSLHDHGSSMSKARVAREAEYGSPPPQPLPFLAFELGISLEGRSRKSCDGDDHKPGSAQSSGSLEPGFYRQPPSMSISREGSRNVAAPQGGATHEHHNLDDCPHLAGLAG